MSKREDAVKTQIWSRKLMIGGMFYYFCIFEIKWTFPSTLTLSFISSALWRALISYFQIDLKNQATRPVPAFFLQLKWFQFPLKYEIFFPPGLYLLCTDAEGELLKFCNKNKLGFASTCFPPFNNASSLLLPASVYSSANYFCSQLTKINDGINIYWRSLWEQYASPEEGWVLFPSGKATQQTGLRVICCGAYRWSRSISGTPFMKIAFS